MFHNYYIYLITLKSLKMNEKGLATLKICEQKLK